MKDIICPDCKCEVKYYHDSESTKVVCKNKCNGWKIIKELRRFKEIKGER